jgi:hypothetical protein
VGSASDDEDEFLRVAIVTELADWMVREPEAAERWSGMKREDLLEFQSARSSP